MQTLYLNNRQGTLCEDTLSANLGAYYRFRVFEMIFCIRHSHLPGEWSVFDDIHDGCMTCIITAVGNKSIPIGGMFTGRNDIPWTIACYVWPQVGLRSLSLLFAARQTR